ncbi:MAG: hypothetical protein ACTSYL_12845 [Candidatus Thorarchaeota archaeon]
MGVGLVKARDLLLNPDIDPQGAMDILGSWIGQEMGKEMLRQKIVSPRDPVEAILEKLMNVVQIAEDLEVYFEGDVAHVIVQDCQICPRRVGGYDLEGHTACPVGGVVRGAILTVTGKALQMSHIYLKTGDICKIDFKLN